jgi:uncharacterized protein (TIGR03435 family)
MRFHGLASVLLAGSIVYGQPAEKKKLEFEVASIRPSAPPGTGGAVAIGIRFDGAQMRCSQLSVKDYLGMAYNLKEYQISTPDWMRGARFEISAKIPDGVSRDQIPEMLQALLIERFELKMHRETKDFPVYSLTVAKGGHKMKEIPADAEADAEARKAPVNAAGSGGPQGVSINLGNGSSFTMANNKLEARKIPMSGFADTLARFTDKPVIDNTGLTGNYDLTLEFTPEDFRALHIRSAVNAGVVLPPEALRALEAPGDSLFGALSVVGLKLESRKAPLELLVIDAARKTPTEN